MIFIKCVVCCFLYILFFMDNYETKLSVAVIKLPGLNGERYLRQNILRDEYEEACLKVAIRKCFKALTEVRKRVCGTKYRCKSKFKSYFKKMSKVGCRDEFAGPKIPLKAKKKLYVSRNRYLDTCIPHMVPQNKKRRNNITLRKDTLRTLIERLLRSSSERECEDMSRDKCKSACYYAKDETCDKYYCSSGMKRSLKKACKRECRQQYIIRKGSSKSSSDSD